MSLRGDGGGIRRGMEAKERDEEKNERKIVRGKEGKEKEKRGKERGNG